MPGRVAMLSAVCASALASGCGGATDDMLTTSAAERPAAPASPLDAALEDAAAATFPGVLALVRTPEGEWSGAAGLSDLETERAAAPDDRFPVASLTKTFVAAVIAQLVSEGVLSFDDPVAKWLSDARGDVRKATVRQLLNHTSGVTNGSPDLLFQPGEGWNYSDAAFVLAGRIVEQATGAPIGEVLEERIFEPLALEDTTYGVTGPRMRGYSSGVDVTADEPDPGPAGAAHAIVSNAPDLARFFEALLGGELLDEPALAAMKETVGVPDDAPVLGRSAGLGLFADEVECGPVWGNSGNTDGYVVHVRADETASRLFVLAANAGEPVLLRMLGPAVIPAFCNGP